MKTIRMSIAALAATAALGAVPALAAADNNRNVRAQGAPGYFCKQSGAEPGTTEFRTCVRLAAKARGQARNGDHQGGKPNVLPGTAHGRYCQANGADPGSEGFSQCVRTAAQARRAARS